uniref:U4/U6.U5 small nuclear ribonucleoprotein 27kDa protein domain-containing protein n=1 Tax=Corethron hystrix TaxID=216773 RepID=A0A7S1BT38_9STRA|mmetsp:Transcript_38547/g.89605  ORF Transcript_38547/g.89605 Transcript_38547/m.89605 type:complete len:117 (+) Transcript_38547:66-416(+)
MPKSRKEILDEMRALNEEEEAKVEKSASSSRSSRREGGSSDAAVRVTAEELMEMTEDEAMKKVMGFSGSFGSTKEKKVADNHTTAAKGAASKNKARKYRQYMNRKGGFNRPLDKMK